jgi:Uma2 family endonuclease
MSTKLLEDQFYGIDQIGVKLERVGGLTLWEAQPIVKHQLAVDRIRASIRACTGGGCGCIHLADITVQFNDGSQKRPDISIFCRTPDEEEAAVTLLPEAVIEIISKGYEAKDYEVGVPFYLSMGVKDIVTFDPRSGEVRHYRASGVQHSTSPMTIEFECGCICVV